LAAKKKTDNLIYLAMLTLVLAANMAIASKTPLKKYINQEYEFYASNLPVLMNSLSFPVVSAQAVYVVDLESNVVMYEKNPRGQLLPASTTKIMSAIVALENFNLNEDIVIGNQKSAGQKMGLYEREKINIKDVLKGMLIYSGNDAADVLADNYPQGRSAFVQEMNRKAKEIGAMNTSFTNPSGLDEYGHFSTAQDLVKIAAYAMKNPIFSEIVNTRQTIVTSTDGKIKHVLSNTNSLLGVVEGVMGIKTGWTENARENLVTYIERDGHKIILATLGSQDRFGETREIINWIFSSYKWLNINSRQELARSNLL